MTGSTALRAERVMLPEGERAACVVMRDGRIDTVATAAAAAGGITTIVDMPLNSIPPTVDAGSLATKRRAADGQLAVDVAFWGGAVPGNSDRLRMLHEAAWSVFTCFLLPSGVDEFLRWTSPGCTRP